MLQSLYPSALLAPALVFLLLSVLGLFLERKFIAIAQKRLGISFLGRNGWAHLPADLVKFWLKHTARHQGFWLSSSVGLLGAILGYLTWTLVGVIFFAGDGFTAVSDSWDFQLPLYLAYASLSTLFMSLVVIGTRSKYATLAGVRALLVTVFLEVFFSLCFLLVYTRVGGYSIDEASNVEHILACPPLACWFFLYALFEAKRAPFDHTEAESELVAGHMVEFGGRALLFFYMCEYAHLFFCVFLVLTFFCGALDVAAWGPFGESLGHVLLCG